MEVVRKENGENAAVDEQTVRTALDELKIMDVVKGKAGIAGRGKKDLGEHKVLVTILKHYRSSLIPKQFWATQPVQQAGIDYLYTIAITVY